MERMTGVSAVAALAVALILLGARGSEAQEPAGFTKCVGITVGHTANPDKAEQKASPIPPGWTPVGGSSSSMNTSVVVACK